MPLPVRNPVRVLQLTRIENISALVSLRVLNVAGNQLEELDGAALSPLNALIELNLRRNRIASLTRLEQLPAVERLFLSFNQLSQCASSLSLALSDCHCAALFSSLPD